MPGTPLLPPWLVHILACGQQCSKGMSICSGLYTLKAFPRRSPHVFEQLVQTRLVRQRALAVAALSAATSSLETSGFRALLLPLLAGLVALLANPSEYTKAVNEGGSWNVFGSELIPEVLQSQDKQSGIGTSTRALMIRRTQQERILVSLRLASRLVLALQHYRTTTRLGEGESGGSSRSN